MTKLGTPNGLTGDSSRRDREPIVAPGDPSRREREPPVALSNPSGGGRDKPMVEGDTSGRGREVLAVQLLIVGAADGTEMAAIECLGASVVPVFAVMEVRADSFKDTGNKAK